MEDGTTRHLHQICESLEYIETTLKKNLPDAEVVGIAVEYVGADQKRRDFNAKRVS